MLVKLQVFFIYFVIFILFYIAPARQAALKAGNFLCLKKISCPNLGLDVSTAVTTVNKVCSSGLKAVMLAAQQCQLNHQQVVIGTLIVGVNPHCFYKNTISPSRLQYNHLQACRQFVSINREFKLADFAIARPCKQRGLTLTI
jgi:hypothetical protein